MDPTVALWAIRSAAALIKKADDDDREVVTTELAMSLVEHFEALDEWLMEGGFLPTDWADVRASLTDKG